MSDEKRSQQAAFGFSIPDVNFARPVSIQAGGSAVFVGANGGGKTRLAVLLEKEGGAHAHRIAAHRALTLNPSVPKISERHAVSLLRTGRQDETVTINYRSGHRWHGKEATSLLNDFDNLLQALFAEQTNRTHQTHVRNRAGDHAEASPTNFEKLADIWHRLLPHRQLHITGDDIQVSVAGSTTTYTASEMSDGERAIFYMIGQALTADKDSLLIVDEPELHVHRSIMSRLWDELEASRPDCAFVYITHDLEFAAARTAQKFVIHAYDPTPHWTIEEVPQDTGFSEELTTLILGSRRPVLFVEGGDRSLDLALYRACYSQCTVIPRGSCEEVLHSVVTMRRNKELTRVTCAGLVDADDYEIGEVRMLANHGVATLPVSEIENLFVLPSISRKILAHEGYAGAELESCVNEIAQQIFGMIAKPGVLEDVVLRHCRRRIDRALKRVDLSEARNEQELTTAYKRIVSAVDVLRIAQARRDRIQNAVAAADLPALLALYDNKGVLAVAALKFKTTSKGAFESWLTRVLANNTAPDLVAAVRAVLPEITFS